MTNKARLMRLNLEYVDLLHTASLTTTECEWMRYIAHGWFICQIGRAEVPWYDVNLVLCVLWSYCCPSFYVRSLLPASEGWGKVIFSVCLSVHTPLPGQQCEYLLRSGRYASCVHAGGRSCFHLITFPFHFNFHTFCYPQVLYFIFYKTTAILSI